MSKTHLRTCTRCGVTLEVGECCNCQHPVLGEPRDGLRAKCLYFNHRSSYRGHHYVNCWARRTGRYPMLFQGRSERDEHYKQYCCDCYAGCHMYQLIKGRAEHA